ncbi:MAG: formylglycine-generating enzyme family protein [Deltaproteobacteria bacterium]|nr:formylglycine-generating enzyme family protein [Deltaproteobacteria bacterium]
MLALIVTLVTAAPGTAMASIPASNFNPPFPPSSGGQKEVHIAAFLIDRRPVTNLQFLRFVARHAKWRRDQVPRLLADASYLSHWEAPDRLGPAALDDQPVTRVSWFSAKAYCEALGARLPTEYEWEEVAAASEVARDARSDPLFRQKILAWYSRPTEALAQVGQSPPNIFGVQDMHGLVWEWVLDFGSVLVSNDSRDAKDGLRFCGGAGLTADDKTDYAALMRAAFRASLAARYTTKNLGFRCAKDTRALSSEAP